MSRFLSVAGRKSKAVRSAALALTVLLTLPLGVSSVDAKAGGGLSFGSRGARTFSAPAPTATAPRAAQPLQRTETSRPGFGTPGLGASAQPRGFGFGTGLAAGLLGAGLFGMLTGGGFFGGISGLASLLGLVFQVALIGGLIVLALRFFRGRPSGGPALAGFGSVNRAYPGPNVMSGGAAPLPEPPAIGPLDFSAFERSLGEIQAAFSREDFNGLSRLTTPEMLRVFGAQIEDNQTRGQRNDLRDVRLLQGDLAEAWREGGSEYATVAMRFALRDTMVDRASGRVLSGDSERPSESTELWTFRRDKGSPWLLSAIQQAA